MSASSSPFIERLQQILNDPLNSEIIKFDQGNGRIQIFNKKDFENILSKYFRHARFQSFVRQLNWYGFYKINSKKNISYSHPDLQKGFKIWTIKSRRTLAQERKKQESSVKINTNNDIAYDRDLIDRIQKDHRPQNKWIDLSITQRPFALLNPRIELPLSVAAIDYQQVVPTCKYICFYF